MTRITIFLAVAFSIAIPFNSSWALPAPKTEQEMTDMADLVVLGECVKIVCDGTPIEDVDKITTTYLSTIWPSETFKGGLPNSLEIRGKEYAWKGSPPLGEWHQPAVPKSWVGKLYLKLETDGTYSEVWWNAMVETQGQSNPQPLPNCSGESDGGAEIDSGIVPDAQSHDSSIIADAGFDASSTDTNTTSDSAPLSNTPPLEDDSGCSCKVGTTTTTLAALMLLLIVGLALFRKRV
ncbi:MAG: hypothetical protein V1754_07585 [Pseudomonadota bacterium]